MEESNHFYIDSGMVQCWASDTASVLRYYLAYSFVCGVCVCVCLSLSLFYIYIYIYVCVCVCVYKIQKKIQKYKKSLLIPLGGNYISALLKHHYNEHTRTVHYTVIIISRGSSPRHPHPPTSLDQSLVKFLS